VKVACRAIVAFWGLVAVVAAFAVDIAPAAPPARKAPAGPVARRPAAARPSAGAAQAGAAAEWMNLEPARPNVIKFDGVEAKFVRVVIHKSHSAQPCIDELEVYAPGSEIKQATNLALASAGAKATASGCLDGYAAHKIEHLNDGQYGNARSWIASGPSGWAQIELAKAAVIDRIVLSRDRTGHYKDRVPASFEVQVSSDGKTWTTVRRVQSTRILSSEKILLLPTRANDLEFPPVQARHVRVVIRRTADGGEPCIDELEVYGHEETTLDNLALASAGGRAYASSCLEGQEAHKIEHLNDGQYGNSRSWAGGKMESWAAVELARPATIARVVISRDRQREYYDRMPSELDVQVSQDGRNWLTVKRAVAMENVSVDQPAEGESMQSWADRVAQQLPRPWSDSVRQKLAEVKTEADVRFLLRLVRLKDDAELLKARLDLEFNPAAIRRAVAHLQKTYGPAYKIPADWEAKLTAAEGRLAELRKKIGGSSLEDLERTTAACQELLGLQRSLLLANPLLNFDDVLVLNRKAPHRDTRETYWLWGQRYGMTVNWSCDFRPKNAPVAPYWEDELSAVSLREGMARSRTIYKPPRTHMLQHPEVHFDARTILFAAPSENGAFQVWEIGADGKNLRQITTDTEGDVDNGDPCYLPDGRIIFNSTRLFTGVPCEDGQSYVSNLCLCDADGKNTRLLTFDQESNWYPTVLNDGRVLFTRYEYANVSHQFGRLLFHMNPDGTNQMEFYGSNSYWPNSIFYARPIPNHPTMVAGVVCGHHGPNRTGRLVLLDPARGRHETSGAIQTIPGYGKGVQRVVEDTLYQGDWPKFAHPWPLSESYFLVAARLNPRQLDYAIYLVDVFDNFTEIARLDAHSLLEPIPLAPRPRPPVIRDRVQLDKKTASVYLVDVYKGEGLRGVPRGSVKKLRVFTYNFVYRHTARRGFGHLATPGVDGPWEPRFLLGTVDVNENGSAYFQVPANTPISIQPLDEQGRALQQMRSWFTAMPGEVLSCVGCHERQDDLPPPDSARVATALASVEPWKGPARGFDFEREVQPVLDRYCVGCHDGSKPGRPDLARKSEQDKLRISRDYQEATHSSISTVLTPAYIALHPYVRRAHAESHYGRQVASEFFVDTSLLVQMLRKGHHNVRLDDDAWRRLYAWIDLGAPDQGSWRFSEWGTPFDFYERRREMLARYANRTDDVEWMPETADPPPAFVKPPPAPPPAAAPACANWPFDPAEAKRRQDAAGLPKTIKLELAKGLEIECVLVPAGEFVMGRSAGPADEGPAFRARIDKPFYMARCEITNAQYQALADERHDSGFVSWFSIDWRGEGYPLTAGALPAVRVSQQEATAFCRLLARRTGRKVSLPTETQWEWACRAGSADAMWYGSTDEDFAKLENLAGREVQKLAFGAKPKWFLRDDRFDDATLITAPVGSKQPNAWGLHDMAGNVSEWTASPYRPYPYDTAAAAAPAEAEFVVRGGSWCSRPQDATSATRWKYPAWRKVHNVGFRVIVEP